MNQVVTTSIRRFIRATKRTADSAGRSLNHLGNRHRCYICKSTFSRFYSYRKRDAAVSLFLRELKMVYSDIENFYCPNCGCFDRERHLFMYFDVLNLWESVQGRVLHFAPERMLSRALLDLNPQEYIRADLFPKEEGIRMADVTSLDFPDEHFDFIICCHVLEHVRNDSQALAEIFRVLKKGGYSVLQTPFSILLADSFEDRNIDTDEMRLKFYGEKDHVRVYGQDLFSKLETAGFTLEIKKHRDILSHLDGEYYGVNPEEDLILVSKR